MSPRRLSLDKLSADVETMKKGLTPTMTDEARAKLLREIDVKEKQLQRDAEDAQTAYNSEWQEALSGGRRQDCPSDEEVCGG